MHSVQVSFLPQALREVEEAEGWYLDRSRSAATAFVREVEHGLRLISETARVWPEFEAGTRRYVLQKFPFSIVFRPGEDLVLVVALMHHSREPGYWHGR